MKNSYRLFCCFFVLLLTACINQAPHPQHSAAFAKGQSISPIAACKKSCQIRMYSCLNSCKDNCKNCQLRSKVSTGKNYARYVHEQCVKGGVIARELNSYRDPLQCRKVTCNCSADFDTCIQSCTGVIQKRLMAAPKCC